MSAAVVRTCVECNVSLSRYKCPICLQPTCSLACSKQHKSVRHDESASEVGREAGPSCSSSSSSSLLPELHLSSHDRLKPPAASRFEQINTFVPLNQYGEANLLEDVEYLHFVGQSVSAIGREIVKKGWLKSTSAEEQNRSSSSKIPYDIHRIGKVDKQPAEIRNRQQFEAWLRRLRLPIMLLPDGMSARKENQSRYKANVKRLQCTVQISFPCAPNKDDRRARRSITHHVGWDKPLAEVVVEDIKDRLSIPGGGHRGASISSWKALINREVQTAEGPLRWDELRRAITLVLSLHSDRLRNESSAKFLEWWQRQARNGLVKADGLELDEEKRADFDRARRGEWAPIEGLPEADEEAVMESDAQRHPERSSMITDVATPAGLISTSFLERLQTKRVAQANTNESSAKDNIAGSPPDTMPTSVSSLSHRSLLVLDGCETIEEILRGLGKGLAVVEYPHIEVWESHALKRLFEQGKAKRETLVRQISKEQSVAVSNVATQASDAPNTTALIGLSAYASSDEES